MCFFKNVTSELGDSMMLTAFMEMLTNARGQDMAMMMHEVSLNKYFIGSIILCSLLYYANLYFWNAGNF